MPVFLCPTLNPHRGPQLPERTLLLFPIHLVEILRAFSRLVLRKRGSDVEMAQKGLEKSVIEQAESVYDLWEG
jgi:hypothetical protein